MTMGIRIRSAPPACWSSELADLVKSYHVATMMGGVIKKRV